MLMYNRVLMAVREPFEFVVRDYVELPVDYALLVCGVLRAVEWSNSVLWDSMAGLLTRWFAAVGVLGAADFCDAPFHSKYYKLPLHLFMESMQAMLIFYSRFECLGAVAMWALSLVRLLLRFRFEELVGFLLHLDIDCGVLMCSPLRS
ncbi:hypothetical protein Nepgr_004028 [Nepenthes gracilis]|uniref:Uncharacterized protein n=1 Tax=Nepenthes gracilis TaxID=150966 RepID=A0AAD3XEI5_NEPGR|nr:hypothetical protein Nepgr_004028 [Nepenthes gracilis]